MSAKKTLSVSFQASVPETDTGRLPENGKVLDINLPKELGKLAPYVSNKGSLDIAKCQGRSERAPGTV